MKRFVRIACLTLAVCSVVGLSFAQAAETFPARSLTYLVTFDPGGQSDREARRQQPLLAELLKQTITIDYKVGGGGALGWKELVGAKPDGYFFAGMNIPHIILQPMQQNVGYRTEQLVPVAIFQRTFFGIAVLNDSPYKTLQDLIDDAKKNPGKISIGGVGVYSGHHVAYLQLQKLSGINLAYVPATGSNSQMTTFLGGHTVAVMANQDDLVRFKDKLRVLAMTTDGSSPLFPDAPSCKELGYNVIISIDRGVAVPPGTPTDRIAVLEKAFMNITSRPEIKSAMEKEGFIPVSMGHKESVEYIKRLTQEYGQLMQEMKK